MTFKGWFVPPPGEWGPSGRFAGHAYLPAATLQLVTQISVETSKPAQTQRRGSVEFLSPTSSYVFFSPIISTPSHPLHHHHHLQALRLS